MGRRGYPAEFRRRVLDLVEAGRKVAEIAGNLGIRCLKRYVARELYDRLPHEPLA